MNIFRRCTSLSSTLSHGLKPSTLTHVRNMLITSGESNKISGHLPSTGPLQFACVRNSSCLQIARNHLLQNPRTSDHSSVFSFTGLQAIRWKARGNEYQPKVRKRLTKHGFHKRMKTISGMEILWRRMLKGRTLLVHGNFNRKPFKGV